MHVQTYRQLPPAQEQLCISGIIKQCCGLARFSLIPQHSCCVVETSRSRRVDRCTNHKCMENSPRLRNHFSFSCDGFGYYRGTTHLQQVACTSHSSWASSWLYVCQAVKQSASEVHAYAEAQLLPAASTPSCGTREPVASCLTAAWLPNCFTVIACAVTAARLAARTAAGSPLPFVCAARLFSPSIGFAVISLPMHVPSNKMTGR